MKQIYHPKLTVLKKAVGLTTSVTALVMMLWANVVAAVSPDTINTYTYTIQAGGVSESNGQATLKPKSLNGNKVIDLGAPDNGKTAELPIGTLVYLQFPEGEITSSVSNRDVLDTLKGVYNTPAGTADIMRVVGRGIATLKVTQKVHPHKVTGSAYLANWSGYVHTAANGTYTQISSTWKVPTAICGVDDTYSNVWIGFDGYPTGTDLIQTGTETDCSSGVAQYYAWREVLPREPSEVQVCGSISAGDTMSAGISQTSPGYFDITITDLSNPGVCSFTDNFNYSGSLASAEWIVERPRVNGLLSELTNYSSAVFETGVVNGSSVSLNYSSDSIKMTGDGTSATATLSTPSYPNPSSDGFSTTYCDPMEGCLALDISPTGTTYDDIRAVSSNTSEVWAAGTEYPSKVPITYRFSSGEWSKIAPPLASWGNNHWLYGIAADNSSVWAVGNYQTTHSLTLAYRWNGSSWSLVNSDNPATTSTNQLSAVAIDGAGAPWALGYYVGSSGQRPLLEKWNGTKFANQALTLLPGYEGIALRAIDFDSAGGWAVGTAVLYHYDGTSWTPVLPSGAMVSLYGVESISSTNAWAVGFRGSSPAILHYDGTSWNDSVTNIVWPNTTRLYGIHAENASDIWVVGDYFSGTGSLVNRTPVMFHYDGTNWTRYDTPSFVGTNKTTTLYGVTTQSGKVWAGGQTYTSVGYPSPYVLKY